MERLKKTLKNIGRTNFLSLAIITITSIYIFVQLPKLLEVCKPYFFQEETSETPLQALIMASKEADHNQILQLASKEDADVQNRLAIKYERGDGVEQNIETALSLYQKSASQGHVSAQYNLARLFLKEGAIQDQGKAEHWLSEAAKQDHAAAQYKLAHLYYKRKDYKKAYNWFARSYKNGKKFAALNIAYQYQYGRGVEKDLKKAFEWYFRAEKQISSVNSKYFLGHSYYEGKYVEQDYKKAFEWFSKAAEEGHPESLFYLSRMYYLGHGVEKNMKKSASFAKKNIKAGGEKLQQFGKEIDGFCIDSSYANTQTVDACKYAAYLNHAGSQAILGFLYRTGRGVQKNQYIADEWFEKSILQNNPLGIYFKADYLFNLFLSQRLENKNMIKLVAKGANVSEFIPKSESEFHNSQKAIQTFKEAYFWSSILEKASKNTKKKYLQNKKIERLISKTKETKELLLENFPAQISFADEDLCISHFMADQASFFKCKVGY